MKAALLRSVLVATVLAPLGLASLDCEMLVQLDRSAVDAGDAACTICSDAYEEGDDATNDAPPDASGDGDASAADAVESGADSPGGDAGQGVD